ncbi:MAG: transglutaminase-like domain-containing protein [Bacteroidales bacterium]|jgi:hypothetical protein|nr:transglutaminase-like domain-containing protein [Bacteroidales bacterium]
MRKALFTFVFLASLFSYSNILGQEMKISNKENDALDKREEYLKFLKAYMPLSDIADYDEAFFLKQVDYAIKARDYFSWGKQIPEDIFKHFVLVYRVNNENLDNAREEFFNEIKDRIKSLSMYDAALEVNHWAHQYVNYKASDGRTSSALATKRTSFGRCGEESTFVVTALRSVGIPARQCYTPRWAHTDDNHAWVEVWIDGLWYYLGACEPEPQLNVAWFDAPVKRAMMVHTTVFGSDYKGMEEINLKTDLYSKINLLGNYTTTKKIYVKVVDNKDMPVEDADVDFGLYNYAEFYPISRAKTDKNGMASLTTGLGDLMIWANKSENYAYGKINSRQKDTIFLTLKENTNKEYEELLVIVPPLQRAIKHLDEEKVKENNKRLVLEDSIRNAYIATFPNEEQIVEFYKKLPLFDSLEVRNIIKNSWGNYSDIENFLLENKDDTLAIEILKVIYEKDLRDTPKEVLQSHLNIFKKTKQNTLLSKDEIEKYILNPRIQLELLTSWREYIYNNRVSLFGKGDSFPDVKEIISWIENNIRLNLTDNYYGCAISPKGVIELKESDKLSREILFVALARTFFIASKYDWATKKAQYLENGIWIDAFKSDENVLDNEYAAKNKATLNVHNDISKNLIKPQYYTHFTIARFINGKFITLDYEYDPKFDSFPEKLQLPAGYYRLLTGNRSEDGSVYIKTNYFYLKPNTTSDIFVSLREIPKNDVSFGEVSLKKEKIKLIDNKKYSLDKLSDNKGMVIVFMEPQREPTIHIMADIPLFKEEFDQWGGNILFVVPEKKLSSDFSPTKYKNLPKNSLFAIDGNEKLLKTFSKATNKNLENDFPLILLIDKNGKIVFLSQGYIIGIGEKLIKAIYNINK